MRYELFKCPICGSEKIVLLKEEQVDNDSVCFYKCLSCDSKFNSKFENIFLYNDDRVIIWTKILRILLRQ